jgi:flagellar biosynthesis/type III secretory pathway protein FliH
VQWPIFLERGEAAIAAVASLTEEQSKLYLDVIMATLPEADRHTLEAKMTEGYELVRRLDEKGRAEGRAQGHAEGTLLGRTSALQDVVVKMSTYKLGRLSAEKEAALRSIQDEETLMSLSLQMGEAINASEALIVYTRTMARIHRDQAGA